MENAWDCIVVDAGGQSNRDAHDIGGLLGHDGRPPAEFYAGEREELAAYDRGAAGRGDRGRRAARRGFVLELADGSRAVARRVLLATGMDCASGATT